MAQVLDLIDCFPEPDDPSIQRGPLPKQRQFIEQVLDPNGPKYLAYYGGYGSGKSLILCITMLIQGLVHGGEYVIGRQHMPELRRTTMKQFLEIVPKELILEHRVADAEITIKSQGGTATFYFVGLDEPGKLDSLNLSGFAIDESSYVTEEAFLKLHGRLRNKKGLRKGILVGNPKGHNWVWRRFVAKRDLQVPPGMTLQQVRDMYQMIVAPSTENVHLPEGYVEGMMASYSSDRIKRDIYGSFDSFEGMIYDDFERAKHVIAPFDIPEHWTRAVGADHGYTNPSAWVWGAVDPDGDMYIYREFYEAEWSVEEICKGKGRLPGVVQRNRGEKLEGVWIDPSTKAQGGRQGANKKQEKYWDVYQEHIPKSWALLPANNKVNAGIDRVKTYLKPHPRTGKPRLYIFDTCPKLIDEIGEYQWKELPAAAQGTKNEMEEPRKYKDHAMDALRYLVMGRPEYEAKQQDWYERTGNEYNSLAGALHRDLRTPAPRNDDPFGEEY